MLFYTSSLTDCSCPQDPTLPMHREKSLVDTFDF